MGKVFKHKLTRKLQNIFWIYLNNIYFINSLNDFRKYDPRIKCGFIPITLDNYQRVRDFREENRISEYSDKLIHGEIGFFAEHSGQMIGSIWATINKSELATIAKTYMRLMPGEGLIHDIVTGEYFRGMGVGPFMVRSISPVLLKEYELNRLIIDVNIRNSASLRMLDKTGLRINHTTLNISAFGTLVMHLVLKRYA
jgi:RimJ/RimL family protein N-acetyltransferase